MAILVCGPIIITLIGFIYHGLRHPLCIPRRKPQGVGCNPCHRRMGGGGG